MTRLATLLALGAATGCAYYNAMWSAERFAKDAQRLEARGQEPEARALWARAAAKAESVIVHHPRSRWADDALVLKAEGLARAGTCTAATPVIIKARNDVTETALRERVALAAAQCALAGGRPVEAETALVEVLASRHDARRSRAELLAGEAAAARLDYDAAVTHFRRSRERAALPARARALLAGERAADAAAVIDSLAPVRLRESERADLFVALAAAGGVKAASTTLDRQLRDTRLPFVEQAHLLLDDGDRLLAAGDREGAEARYRQVGRVVPVTAPEAAIAGVRVQRVALSRARSRDDLVPIVAELARIARTEGGGNAGAQRLIDQIATASTPAETPGARIRAAELARDSLGAAALAGRLFVDAAAGDTASLYAPKALLAALPLLPELRDSIMTVLEGKYGTSPYTRAYRGEPSVAYAAAEDSLARELGIQTTTLAARGAGAGSRFDAPVPGPRGPWLDDESRAASQAPQRHQPVRPPRAETERRPARERPARPTSESPPP